MDTGPESTQLTTRAGESQTGPSSPPGEGSRDGGRQKQGLTAVPGTWGKSWGTRTGQVGRWWASVLAEG